MKAATHKTVACAMALACLAAGCEPATTPGSFPHDIDHYAPGPPVPLLAELGEEVLRVSHGRIGAPVVLDATDALYLVAPLAPLSEDAWFFLGDRRVEASRPTALEMRILRLDATGAATPLPAPPDWQGKAPAGVAVTVDGAGLLVTLAADGRAPMRHWDGSGWAAFDGPDGITAADIRRVVIRGEQVLVATDGDLWLRTGGAWSALAADGAAAIRLGPWDDGGLRLLYEDTDADGIGRVCQRLFDVDADAWSGAPTCVEARLAPGDAINGTTGDFQVLLDLYRNRAIGHVVDGAWARVTPTTAIIDVLLPAPGSNTVLGGVGSPIGPLDTAWRVVDGDVAGYAWPTLGALDATCECSRHEERTCACVPRDITSRVWSIGADAAVVVSVDAVDQRVSVQAHALALPADDPLLTTGPSCLAIGCTGDGTACEPVSDGVICLATRAVVDEPTFTWLEADVAAADPADDARVMATLHPDGPGLIQLADGDGSARRWRVERGRRYVLAVEDTPDDYVTQSLEVRVPADAGETLALGSFVLSRGEVLAEDLAPERDPTAARMLAGREGALVEVDGRWLLLYQEAALLRLDVGPAGDGDPRLASDGVVALVPLPTGTLRFVDLERGELLGDVPGVGAIDRLVFGADGRPTVVVVAEDGAVSVFVYRRSSFEGPAGVEVAMGLPPGTGPVALSLTATITYRIEEGDLVEHRISDGFTRTLASDLGDDIVELTAGFNSLLIATRADGTALLFQPRVTAGDPAPEGPDLLERHELGPVAGLAVTGQQAYFLGPDGDAPGVAFWRWDAEARAPVRILPQPGMDPWVLADDGVVWPDGRSLPWSPTSTRLVFLDVAGTLRRVNLDAAVVISDDLLHAPVSQVWARADGILFAELACDAAPGEGCPVRRVDVRGELGEVAALTAEGGVLLGGDHDGVFDPLYWTSWPQDPLTMKSWYDSASLDDARVATRGPGWGTPMALEDPRNWATPCLPYWRQVGASRTDLYCARSL